MNMQDLRRGRRPSRQQTRSEACPILSSQLWATRAGAGARALATWQVGDDKRGEKSKE